MSRKSLEREQRDQVDGMNAVFHLNQAVEKISKVIDKRWLYHDDHERLEKILGELDNLANRVTAQMVIH